MMLFLRFQVEAFAYKKWGGPAGLDAEYERREVAKKLKKDKRFEEKLKTLRNRTRAEALTTRIKERALAGGVGVHEHKFGEAYVKDDAEEDMQTLRCEICGLEVDEVVI